DLPLSRAAHDTVVEGRETIKSILTGDDRRMLVIVGPCSIHDEKAALEYAARLSALARQLADKLVLVMRIYFEKPRTTLGWKGLTAVIHTTGNPWGHLILRGGGGKPNYDPQTVADAARRLADAKLPTGIMVDCSHANSGKKCEHQEVPFRHVVEQRAAGQVGVM